MAAPRAPHVQYFDIDAFLGVNAPRGEDRELLELRCRETQKGTCPLEGNAVDPMVIWMILLKAGREWKDGSHARGEAGRSLLCGCK